MLKRYILIISAIINIVSILAILGWMFQLESLTRVVSELPSMKFNTALCFIFLGATIVLIVKHYNIVFAHIVNAFLLIVGLLTLSQDIFAIDLGIDQFIVEDYFGIQSGNPHPGRMSSATSLSFSLLGISLLLILLGKPNKMRFAPYMSQAVPFFWDDCTPGINNPITQEES